MNGTADDDAWPDGINASWPSDPDRSPWAAFDWAELEQHLAENAAKSHRVRTLALTVLGFVLYSAIAGVFVWVTSLLLEGGRIIGQSLSPLRSLVLGAVWLCWWVWCRAMGNIAAR